MQSALEIVSAPVKAAALLAPQRIQLLGMLAEPDSAAGLARRLSLPRQQVNYHLRELEKAELVELVGERRKGNCTERLMQATARSYLVSPEVLGSLLPPAEQDRFSSAWLATATARALTELADLRSRADETGKRVAALTLSADVRFATPAARLAFSEEISAALKAAIARHHNDAAPDGRTFRVLLGAYPAPAD